MRYPVFCLLSCFFQLPSGAVTCKYVLSYLRHLPLPCACLLHQCVSKEPKKENRVCFIFYASKKCPLISVTVRSSDHSWVTLLHLVLSRPTPRVSDTVGLERCVLGPRPGLDPGSCSTLTAVYPRWSDIWDPASQMRWKVYEMRDRGQQGEREEEGGVGLGWGWVLKINFVPGPHVYGPNGRLFSM
jgi:hypothetical protein